VDFRVTEDQEALREGVRAFCAGRVPESALPALADAGGVDRVFWRDLAEMGVFSLRLPEGEGGLGLGAADAVLVFAELGRRLVPGPLLWSHLAAGLVPGAASGEVVVGGLDLLRPSSDPLLVEHPGGIDALLLLRPEGVFRVDAAKIEAAPVAVPLDPLTPLAHADSLPEGVRLAGPEVAVRMRQIGGTLAAAQLLGIAEETLALAVAYAKSREQFGRPIGSFQALKHLMADMFVRQEQARAAVYAAGATLDHPDAGDASRAVAVAKLCAGEAALRNARACIQVHGGMGFTWEMPPHFYLKRTWVLETVFGTSEEHALRLSEGLGAAA
jgi:alkylation response protein AidB-like acyl-CoA dehydrogenase